MVKSVSPFFVCTRGLPLWPWLKFRCGHLGCERASIARRCLGGVYRKPWYVLQTMGLSIGVPSRISPSTILGIFPFTHLKEGHTTSLADLLSGHVGIPSIDHYCSEVAVIYPDEPPMHDCKISLITDLKSWTSKNTNKPWRAISSETEYFTSTLEYEIDQNCEIVGYGGGMTQC